MKLAILDYGVGNIRSIINAFARLNVHSIETTNQKNRLIQADGIILPGVGAFSACVSRLENTGLIETLNEVVLINKKPILGICVGMQLMANSSKEGGYNDGLGWIPGRVERIKAQGDLRVPHVGWNKIEVVNSSPIFNNLKSESHFYFDHSYHYIGDMKYVAATCHYGEKLNVAISLNNIFGVQFHPEKSALSGLRMFRGYLNWIKEC